MYIEFLFLRVYLVSSDRYVFCVTLQQQQQRKKCLAFAALAYNTIFAMNADARDDIIDYIAEISKDLFFMKTCVY